MGTEQNPTDQSHQQTQTPDASESLDRNVLKRTAEHLHERYSHVVGRETVDRVVQESYDELKRTSRIQAHVVASAGNFADNRLRAMAIAAGAIESTDPRVLFICNGNAGRSQMAASLLAKRSEGRIATRSAGVVPAGSLIETAVEAMAEVGVPLENAYPKPISSDIHQAAQHVVTFGCADRVEQLEGKDYRDWDLPTIVDMSLEEVREVRDEIDQRVQELMRELEGAESVQGSRDASDTVVNPAERAAERDGESRRA